MAWLPGAGQSLIYLTAVLVVLCIMHCLAACHCESDHVLQGNCRSGPYTDAMALACQCCQS